MMRFVVEYRLAGGSKGIMLFTADTEDNAAKNAAKYVAEMICRYGYAYVSDPIVLSGGIEELYRVTDDLTEAPNFERQQPFWKLAGGARGSRTLTTLRSGDF